MTENRHEEQRLRRRIARAEAALAAKPDSLERREALARAWLSLVEALHAAGRIPAAAQAADSAAALAEPLYEAHPDRPSVVDLCADVLAKRAQLVPLLAAAAEEEARSRPDDVPDHLPPDVHEAGTLWQRAIEIVQGARPGRPGAPEP